MFCPKCKAECKGAVARCTQCNADLLPKKSLLRSRLPALIFGLIGVIPPFLFFLGPRVPSFFASAFGPTLLGDRYRFRGEDVRNSDPEQAIADFTKALELAPDYVRAGRVRIYCLRGEAYYKLGMRREAMADFEQALEMWTGGVVAPSTKQWYETLLEDLRAIELDPNTIEDEQLRAAKYARRAEAWYRRGRDLAEDDATRAACYTEAAENAARAIKLDPKSGDGYRMRGYTYYRMGQIDAAIEDLEKAVSLISDQTRATGIRNDVERIRAGASPQPSGRI